MIKAVVYRRRKKRFSKGFSREELKVVGLNIKEALSLNVPVDVRRKTKHEENIETLRRFLVQTLKKA